MRSPGGAETNRRDVRLTKARQADSTTASAAAPLSSPVARPPSAIAPVRGTVASAPSAVPMPRLSVVVPVHNEAGNVVPLSTEIVEVMTAIGRPFEVIFVNDGSTDATLAELRAQAARQACLRILDLDGNFGEAAALSAGFRAARGELVLTVDGDGQNDPHDFPRLLETLERRGCRVVTGWRRERQQAGFMLRVLPSRVANWLIAAVSGVCVHDNGCGTKVYRRDVVAQAALPRGMNRFLPAIFGVAAADVVEIPVNDRRREHGASHYGISRTLVVLRDLLALRFMQRDPERAERGWAVAVVVAAGVDLYGVWSQRGGVTLPASLVVMLGLLIWWNLRRFNAARTHGVCRVRREYSAVHGV